MKVLGMMVLFFIVLLGCGNKYADVEGELSGSKVVDSWKELSVDFIRLFEWGIRLNIHVMDFNVVRKRIRLKDFYGYNPGIAEGENFLTFLGLAAGCYGCYSGYKYGLDRDEDYTPSLLFPTISDKGCQTACLWSLPGCLIMVASGLRNGERAKVKEMPDFIKEDTICVNSELMSMQKVEISIEELGLEKLYCTDEDGGIELKFDELIPEPREADSILTLIIQYKKMADTVNVEVK